MSQISDQNDAENGEADERDSMAVFKSPIHARFSELENRWSGIKQCSSMRHLDSPASVTSATASVRRSNAAANPGAPAAARRTKSEQSTSSSVSSIPRCRDSHHPSSASQHSHQSKRTTGGSISVFERLYSHGKAKVAAARRGKAFRNPWNLRLNVGKVDLLPLDCLQTPV